MTQNSDVVPIEEKWDHSVENLIRKSTLGFAVGLLPALILSRSAAGRAAIAMFTTGFGTGVAYNEARYLFDRNVTFDRRHVVSVTWFPTEKKDAPS
jgi:inner membrane organizing system protein 1